MINGPSSHSKAVLEKKIIEYGGSISQNPGTGNDCGTGRSLTLVLLDLDIYVFKKDSTQIKCH